MFLSQYKVSVYLADCTPAGEEVLVWEEACLHLLCAKVQFRNGESWVWAILLSSCPFSTVSHIFWWGKMPESFLTLPARVDFSPPSFLWISCLSPLADTMLTLQCSSEATAVTSETGHIPNSQFSSPSECVCMSFWDVERACIEQQSQGTRGGPWSLPSMWIQVFHILVGESECLVLQGEWYSMQWSCHFLNNVVRGHKFMQMSLIRMNSLSLSMEATQCVQTQQPICYLVMNKNYVFRWPRWYFLRDLQGVVWIPRTAWFCILVGLSLALLQCDRAWPVSKPCVNLGSGANLRGLCDRHLSSAWCKGTLTVGWGHYILWSGLHFRVLSKYLTPTSRSKSDASI